MAKKLVSRSEFARLAGVSGASVTKACKGSLKSATEGKRVDAAHPAAVEYIAKQERARSPQVATGIDPFYEDAISICRETGRWSATFLRSALGIGAERAKKLFKQIELAGIVPGPEIVVVDPPQVKPPHVRGTAAAREKKKQETPPPNDYIFEVPEDIQAFADMSLRELVERFGTDLRFLDWLKATKAIEDINEKRLKNAQTKGELVSRQLVKVGIIEPIDAAHIKLLTDGAKTIARRVTAMHDAGRDLEDIEKFVADQVSSFIRPVKSKVARALRDA